MDVITNPGLGVHHGPTALKVTVRDFPSDKLGLSEEFRANGIFSGICARNSARTLHCIKRGDDVNIVCKITGNSLLHTIMVEASPMTEAKYVPIVYQLSMANVNFDVVNNNGLTPLQLSIKMHLLELMVALIKCGATCKPEEDDELIIACSGPVEYEFRSQYRKFSPGFWLPIEEDKAFKVNVLVKSWCRVNISKQGKSLIEFAKEKEVQEKIVKLLTDNEVAIEFAHATIAGDHDKMKTLLQHFSVDLETKDFSHKENYFEPYCPLTLYGAAVKYGHRHVLSLLKCPSEKTVQQSKDADPTNPSTSSVCSIL